MRMLLFYLFLMVQYATSLILLGGVCYGIYLAIFESTSNGLMLIGGSVLAGWILMFIFPLIGAALTIGVRAMDNSYKAYIGFVAFLVISFGLHFWGRRMESNIENYQKLATLEGCSLALLLRVEAAPEDIKHYASASLIYHDALRIETERLANEGFTTADIEQAKDRGYKILSNDFKVTSNASKNEKLPILSDKSFVLHCALHLKKVKEFVKSNP